MYAIIKITRGSPIAGINAMNTSIDTYIVAFENLPIPNFNFLSSLYYLHNKL